MRKEIFDLETMNFPLDPEDQELMAMFPPKAQMILDDMVLVKQGEKLYLESKAAIRLRRRQTMAILRGVYLLAAVFCLTGEACAIVGNFGSPWMWLVGFMACILPELVKVPAEVKKL